MKFILLLTIGMMLCSCISSHPLSPNRKIHPEFSDLDDLEMMLLNEHDSIYDSTPQRRVATQYETPAHLRLGMARQNVKMSLGSPTQVEVAGNPKYGNERWTYERAVPTLNGYYKERKLILFEGGSVVGWENH